MRSGEHKLAKDRWWARGQAQPGVNFINVLQADFMRADPESVKMTVKLSIFFAISGSLHVKAGHRTLMKLTPVPLVGRFVCQLMVLLSIASLGGVGFDCCSLC